LLRAGLELWRGNPLAGMPGDWAATMQQAWQRQRIEAAVSWADERAGDPSAVLDELTGLVLAHPLHEPLAAALMRSLHAAGRTDEALACYRKLRQELVEQLGVDPGTEAQQAHQAILRGDLDQPRTPSPPVEVTAVVPAQLPADVAGFTGRRHELHVLQEHLTTAGTAMVITAVAGTGGVGKTALAVRFAHLVRDRFPDGQLHLNLRGYDHEQPVAPGDALAAFLRALGVPPPQIPADVHERAGLYRTLVSSRRMLILLDNASTVDQVGLLLPGSPHCLVLVTSRDSLPGLVVRHGAHRVLLDVLPHDEAITLLRKLIGPRVDAERTAADALADQCGRLPLALRIAAELAVTQPGDSLASLVEDLADEQRRLDLLDAAADPRTGIRAVFAFSYKQLPAEAARAFRRLGVHPGLDLDPYAAAALLGTDLSTAKRLLDALTRAHLLHRTGPHRFGMHDLLRVYAGELETADDRRAALTRLFDHYLHTITTAMNRLTPGDRHRRPTPPVPATPSPDVATDALAWADAERANLVAAVKHAAAHDHPAHAVWLATVLRQYLDIGGHYDDALAVQADALRTARDHGDQTGEAAMLAGLGTVHLRRGDYSRSAELYRQAIDLHHTTGNRTEQAHVLINLGNVRHMQGRFDEAVGHYRRALTLLEQLADRMGRFRVLHNLGNTIRAQGDYRQATDHLTRALVLIREIGDRDGEAHSLDDLGYVQLRLGNHASAADHCQKALDAYEEVNNPLGIAHALNNLAAIRLRQQDHAAATALATRALALYRGIGARTGEAQALATLGCIAAEQGDLDQATTHHRASVALFTALGSAMGEATALNNLGTVSTTAGRTVDAHTEHSAALAIAERTGDRYERARALAGLGHALHGDDPAEALHLWQRALDGFTSLGVPEAGYLAQVVRSWSPSGTPNSAKALNA
jgi:tetratricopeptide (TPR) repeat protein